MKTREKLVLTLIAIIIIASGIILALVSVPLLSFRYIIDYVELMVRNPFLGMLLSAVLVVLALLLLIKGFKRDKESKYFSQEGSGGEVRVSFSTLESLVHRVCFPRREIKNLKTKIALREGNLEILIRMSVLPDTNIPDLIEELQDSVKNYLEEMTGFTIGEVKIMVDTVSEEKG